MRKYEVEVDGCSIYLYTDSKKVSSAITEDSLKFTKTIPCTVSHFGEVDHIVETENFLYYGNSDIKDVTINVEKNTSILYLPEEKLFIPDLVYLAICMLANQFQKQNKYFVQASVVKYDDSGSIMFIGDPNSGKTTLSAKLLMSGNWSLVANDNVLVGLADNKLQTIAGTKNMQMRYGGLKLFFPDLSNHVQEPVEERDEWDIKVYVDRFLDEMGIRKTDNSIITDVYLINTNKDGQVVIREREEIDKLLLMYEHLTKQIRSNRYVLTSFDYPIPSFEQESYMKERYDMAKKIVENTSIYDLRGDVDNAIYQLRKKHER